MLINKKLKSIPIEFFLFILLIHHVRVEAKVTGMEAICTDVSQTKCITIDGELGENYHCISGFKKIYKSDTSCGAINNSAAVVSIFEKKADRYTAGTIGTTTEGIIYSCASGGTCEQLVSTYYAAAAASSKLYKCDATGKCTIQASASGTYLTGVGAVGANGVVTYTSAVTCASGSCNAIATAGGIFVDAATTGNIINCASAASCTSSPGSSAPGVAYIDGSDTNKKTIITCTGSACSSKSLASDLLSSKIFYYIDGSAPNKFIKCDDTDGCVSVASTSVIQPDGTNSDRMLVCTAIKGCIATKKITECDSSTTTGTGDVCKDTSSGNIDSGKVCIKSDGVIYKSLTTSTTDADTENVTETKSCTAQATPIIVKDNAIGILGTTDSGLIFVCGASSCTQVISAYYKDSSATPAYLYSCDNTGLCTRKTTVVKGVHLSGAATPGNKGYTYGEIIKCTDTTITSCTTTTAASATGVYLDADNTKNVITCASSICYSSPGVTTPGFVYQNAGSGKKLIRCSATKCEEVDPKLSTAGFAYMEVNASTNTVLKCDSTTSCSSAGTLAAGNTYIDGTNTDEKNVIYCSGATACSSLEGSTASNYAYVSTLNSGKVITCTNKCAISEGNKVNGYAYINAMALHLPITCPGGACSAAASGAAASYIDAQHSDHVVVCTTTSCISVEANVDQDTAYITNTSLKTVIQCKTTSTGNGKRATTTTTTASASCSVLPAVTSGTSYYIDATDSSKIVTCANGNACNTSTAAEVSTGTAYLNPLVPSRVIQCTTANSVTECVSMDGATTTLPVVHYINATDKAKVLTCTKSTTGVTCQNEQTIRQKSGSYAYRDYLNPGNVILCDSTCTSSAAGAKAADTDPVQSVGYIDAMDTTDKTVITCTDWAAAGAAQNITCSTVEVKEADGRAFLDGTSTYSNGFEKILIYSTSDTKVKQATNNLSTSGFAYIDGTDESKKRIIKCTSSTTCVAYNNGSAEADASSAKPAVNAFYIDGVTNTNYIICKPSEGCSSHPGTEADSTLPKYYPDSINAGYVIECAANQGTCQKQKGEADTVGYYVDGYTDGILSCGDGTKICAPLPTVNTEELTGYVHFGKNSVIHCSVEVTTTPKRRAKATPTTTTKAVTTSTSTVCVALPTNTSTTDAYYYINANDSSSIITCPTNSGACTSASAPTTSVEKARTYNNPSDSKIIQCTTEDSKTVCKGKEGASEANPKVHYIEAVSPFTNIITCLYDKTTKATTCSKLAAVTDDGVGYIDFMNKGYVITCQTSKGKCTSDESPAKAKTDALPVQNANYIDGYDTTKTTVITCVNKGNSTTSDTNCAAKTYTSLPDGHAFLDGASSANNEFKNLLTYDATNKNMMFTAPAKFSTDSFFYIDGSDDDLETIINCITGPVCKAETNKADEEVNAFYINGLNVTSIITCTNENGCISDTGSKVSGQAYRNSVDLKKIITCSDSACAASVGVDSTSTDKTDSYINADNPSQIIHCPDSTKDCLLMDSNASANRSSYFPRYKEESSSLLNCTRYSSTNTTCELTTTTATHKFNVFLNALYNNEELTTAKPLITCDKDNKCKPSDPTFANESKSSLYYPNSDPVNTKEDLIICSKDSDNNVKCSIGKGKEKDVYLNANFDSTNNKKQIIICGVGESCLEQSNNSTSATDLRYFVNAGVTYKNALNDTLIECNKDTCAILTTVEDDDIYIDEFDNSHIIHCTESKGCVSMASQATDKKNEIFLNSSNLHKESGTEPEKNEPLKNDIIKCVNTNSTITCSAQDGQPDEVYVNSHNTTEIIYCTANDGCKSKASEALTTQPEFYINADPTDEEKLDGDLIRCKNTGIKITCEVIKGGDGDVYLNANVNNDANKKPLIICSKEMGCMTDASKVEADSLPAYYVNSGSVSTRKLNDTLIECTYDKAAECEIRQAVANDVYVNYANNTETHPLIKCNNNGCKVAMSSATENNNEYYLNAGDKDEKALTYDIIECADHGDGVECEELGETGEGVYLNSNYSESGDDHQLIFCSSDNGCEGIKTSARGSDYYVNAEASDLTNAVIFCFNKKCEKQTPEGIPTYYVGSTQEGETKGLIECNKLEVDTITTATATTTTAATSTVAASVRRKRATKEICKLKSAFNSNGYYLNAGYNKAINQTIICDSSDGCETIKVDLGYYVNAGDDTKPIIKCEKEGSECSSEESKACPITEDAVSGDYCYDEGSLKFFPEGNSTAIAASKSDDIYTFATIPSGGFPGIKSETGALFKISRYFINRFYQSGIVMIDKNGKLVDNLSSADQSDVSLYDCNDSTKTCSLRPGCTNDTYMYDSENKKAVFCNSGKLEYAEFTGYVVDSNRVVGSNHPYIIQCENNGNKCSSFKPKVNSYYENSGFDSATNSLIECSNNNCVTKTADVGYYIGHKGEGIIQCTSSTSCTYSKAKSNVKYVNAGSNKSSNAIISCSKSGCSSIKANIGYYLTYTNTLLIQCTSPSNCVEFTPTVNYYDNADSTESSNTIINCVQSSQVVTCAPEATNNGFYMSSSPNVLIRCKSGNKCKAIKVKNGIFRGAIKALTGGSSKRADEEDADFEEDGKRVAMPRDSDDSYDIIRCVQEKCSALSPSEVSAIPICEFNNNKCYITLDYAMTKSATTSISAGNICTNSDRSVFYFATDTIVVKPNVISGVTATYVFTTTNSNCLEVNDSYSDMYFTVGSNIYLLDQGSVLQFYEQGYYFINTAKNAIVNGNDIDNYNDENVKLYKCNGNSCSIMDKPDSLTYYADVNKRIIRYNVNSDSYSFAYDKDVTCIFANNKCTPNADLKNQEFCITYKGELALATTDIKNRETGECYKAGAISSNIYGYSQYLYNMNLYSAQMIDETGYYIVSLSTNTTVVSKNYKTKNNKLVIYGCQLSSCKVIEPEENVYYYDARAKTILRYKDGVWKTPDTSGYAYISIDPTNTYIYRFTKNAEEVKINGMANYGYYYTVDGEMYNCDRDEDGDCTPIDNTGYYFTNAGEVYYCVHDSEEIEPTECTKQACVSGQYYYIDEAYYRCESSSSLVPVMSRYCSYNENVVINFPLALTEEFPDKIKQAVEGIEKNNNSTAIVSRRGKNYLESVSGIFTNCTYNVEETKSTFDLVCVNNFVAVDEETDDIKICSMEQLGYVECIEDEENPEKCNVSGSMGRLSLSILSIIITTLLSILFL